METRANYVIVGLFVVILTVGLFAFALWLEKTQFEVEVAYYDIYFVGPVTGLKKGSIVSYRGITVGTVDDIEIDPKNLERVIVTIDVKANTPIRRDTVASLEVQGIAGVPFILLSGGTEASPPLTTEKGQRYPVIASVPSRIEQVLAGAPATLTLVLVAGAARLLAGAALAVAARMWRPVAFAVGSIAGLASAVPATIVALILVKVLSAHGDASIALLVGALLVTGWAGPYGVIRSELDRLAVMPFTTGARALGVTRARLILRHQLPHLVPLLALNLSQQIVSALVLVAELGVLGVYVATRRRITRAAAPSHVGVPRATLSTLAGVPEWGVPLAKAPPVESLWLGRWLIFAPGIAFAHPGVVIALTSFALARRYTTHDIFSDVTSRWARIAVIVVLGVFALSAVVPQRYAAATSWAATARATQATAGSTSEAFARSGLTPLGADYAVTRHITRVVQTGAATVEVGDVRLEEPWPRPNDPPLGAEVRSYVAAVSGGGSVDAPLVFAARGIVPSDYPPGPPVRPYPSASGLDLGTQIRDYADDYAGLDVQGKVVVLVRFAGIAARERDARGTGYTAGPDPEASIATAVAHGAAAVIFIDPFLPYYRSLMPEAVAGNASAAVAGVKQYADAERLSPPTESSRVPVVVVSAAKGKALLDPLGVDITPLLGWDAFGDASAHATSVSRPLGVSAQVSVPVVHGSADFTSYAGVTPGASVGQGYVVIWAVRRPDAQHPTAAVLARLSAAFAHSGLPVAYVDFDPTLDASANAKAVREAIDGRRIALLVALDRLDGDALTITTPFGDLIPAFEQYAQIAGVPHQSSTTTPSLASLGDSAPLLGVRTVLISGNAKGSGDLRPEGWACVVYLVGRRALGAGVVPG